MLLWFWLPLTVLVGVRVAPMILGAVMVFVGKREDDHDPIARY